MHEKFQIRDPCLRPPGFDQATVIFLMAFVLSELPSEFGECKGRLTAAQPGLSAIPRRSEVSLRRMAHNLPMSRSARGKLDDNHLGNAPKMPLRDVKCRKSGFSMKSAASW